MKKQLHHITLVLVTLLVSHFDTKAQTTSTFESLTLSPGSYWDGSSSPGGATFNDGNAIFPNFYDTAFFYWATGWAYSNMQDSTTAGFTNLFSAITAAGYNGSANYAVGTYNPVINLNANAIGKVVNGFYITNSTIAALSMRDGDAFAKKFGGPSGNDPDWFKVTVKKWFGGSMSGDSVEVYLADYRFSNNAQDYILQSWQWVDLTSLGNADSLQLYLTSSDVGSFGMNTPAFFCIDNFVTADSPSSVAVAEGDHNGIKVFPNPANGLIRLDIKEFTNGPVSISISDVTGKIIMKESTFTGVKTISVTHLSKGMYTVLVDNGINRISKMFIKQ